MLLFGVFSAQGGILGVSRAGLWSWWVPSNSACSLIRHLTVGPHGGSLRGFLWENLHFVLFATAAFCKNCDSLELVLKRANKKLFSFSWLTWHFTFKSVWNMWNLDWYPPCTAVNPWEGSSGCHWMCTVPRYPAALRFHTSSPKICWMNCSVLRFWGVGVSCF